MKNSYHYRGKCCVFCPVNSCLGMHSHVQNRLKKHKKIMKSTFLIMHTIGSRKAHIENEEKSLLVSDWEWLLKAGWHLKTSCLFGILSWAFNEPLVHMIKFFSCFLNVFHCFWTSEIHNRQVGIFKAQFVLIHSWSSNYSDFYGLVFYIDHLILHPQATLLSLPDVGDCFSRCVAHPRPINLSQETVPGFLIAKPFWLLYKLC